LAVQAEISAPGNPHWAGTAIRGENDKRGVAATPPPCGGAVFRRSAGQFVSVVGFSDEADPAKSRDDFIRGRPIFV